MQAIIYIRFSTLEQREGASVDRQLERCIELCNARGWPVESVRIDQGKSAFLGHHRDEGAEFGKIEAEAKAGLLTGRVLVVERLSRLSRLDHNKTHRLVTDLTENGLTLAIWDGAKIYPSGENIDFASVIELLVKAKLANDESATKRDFGKVQVAS